VKVKIATEPFNGWLLREVLGYISDFLGSSKTFLGYICWACRRNMWVMNKQLAQKDDFYASHLACGSCVVFLDM